MAIVLSFRVIALIMFQSPVLGDAMLLLHLFKLLHHDTERNQVPTLLGLHGNICSTSILAHGWTRSLLVF